MDSTKNKLILMQSENDIDSLKSDAASDGGDSSKVDNDD